MVRSSGGRLMHGDYDRDGHVDKALYEASKLTVALGVPVEPLILMTNAPVAGGGFKVRGVPVIPEGRVLELLRANAGRPDPVRAAGLYQLAQARLPRYVERSGR